MSNDQPTPTTPGGQWTHPDPTAVPSQPAPPSPFLAAGPPPAAGVPYPQGHPGGYPAPGYPPAMPPYGAVPVPGPGGYPGQPSYDGFAIAGFVLGLIGGSLLAIIFGIMGIGRTRGGRARGRWMAVTAVVLGSLWMLGVFAAMVVVAMRGPTSTYAVGDCVQTSSAADVLREGGDAPALPQVSCAVPHDGEVYAAKDLPAGPYPGLSRVTQEADAYCTSEFERFIGLPYDDSELSLFYVYPQEVGWRTGDHEVACLVTDVDQVTGTLRGAAR